jgi:wyosine [tRNA(Phe)-imidazoG37] synthetase (radical SAM superfamily)
MEKIHTAEGDVLMEVSPLIDFRSKNNIQSVLRIVDAPLHVKNKPGEHKEKQVELSPIHDFSAKLRQPSIINTLKEYVSWQVKWRDAYAEGKSIEEILEQAPNRAPLSVNLDVTTACNYRCDHCVDMDILNTGIRYEHEQLKNSLTTLIDRGLRSVIIIGGGEPTVYPGFADIVKHLKARDIQIGVVTNGSRMDRIAEVANDLTKGDWVRLSLDSGDNDTFRAMHKPVSKKVTLDWICSQIPDIKKINPDFQIGYSFIVVWKDCEANDTEIIDNTDEIIEAAQRARQYEFDYISYKPFLTRAEENNAEVVNLTQEEQSIDGILKKIRTSIDETKQLETENFSVIESTNLRVLENGSYKDFIDQPSTCHMQYFRQVLSPLGVFNCPVYRHVPQALLGGKHEYEGEELFKETQKNTLRLIEAFDASNECRNVTCLYNHANWLIEDLIRNPEKLDTLQASEERHDYFL